MCPRADQSPQLISLTTKKRSAKVLVPTHWGRKAPSRPCVLQAVLVKTMPAILLPAILLPEILFGNAPLANHETTVSDCLASTSQTSLSSLKGQRPEPRTGFGEIPGIPSSYFYQNRHNVYTEQDGHGGVPGWC